MAAARPIAVITKPHGLDEARAMLPELAHEVADEVRRRYGSRYEIELHGSVDGGELADAVLGESNRPVADAETMQTLRVSQGWLMGAMVRLRWSATTSDRVLLTSETQSKLEDRASTVIVGGAGCLGALTGLLSIRLRLIGMLVGACLGLVLGIGAYKIFAAPIFAVIQAGRRRVSTALAVELGSLAARVIQMSPFVAGPPASSEPAPVAAPAPDRVVSPAEEIGAVRTAGPAADRPSPFRRPPSSKPGPHAAVRT